MYFTRKIYLNRICGGFICRTPRSLKYYATICKIADINLRHSSTTTSEKRKSRWQSIGEWRLIGTVGIAIASWYFNAKQEREQNRAKLQIELVTRQIKELYGPLYGNRLVAETSYRSVMRQSGLKKYLEKARIGKDADMIKVWRSYYLNVLYPLDKEGLDMLCSHVHLIADSKFPDEFERFLKHAAQMQFVMENWKNEKDHLKSTQEYTDEDFFEITNSSGIGGSKLIIGHLRERCQMLRKKQQTAMHDINVNADTNTENVPYLTFESPMDNETMKGICLELGDPTTLAQISDKFLFKEIVFKIQTNWKSIEMGAYVWPPSW